MSAKCVIFVLVLRNYVPFNGFRLDQHIYSAYAHEEELLLLGGLKLNVLNI